MARHLRPVVTPSEGPTYVVARTGLAHPGTPFVIATSIDRGLAERCAFVDGEAYDRNEMLADPSLAAAMNAWESGDHSVYRRERAAHQHAAPSPGPGTLRPVPTHPSLLGKIPAP